jgi:hypothetical protein
VNYAGRPAELGQAYLPYFGEGGIFERYLSPNLIENGKGTIQAFGDLKQYSYDVFEMIKHAGIGEVRTGFYLSPENQIQLFVNLGMGAVIYEGLPSSQGKVTFDYYGDALGLRGFDVTPYHIKAELLRDLNEAFKMLTQEME